MPARFTEVDGVFFTEENIELDVITGLKVPAQTQNTSLAELKKQAANEIKRLGGNGLVNYKYSQKADNPLKDFFGFRWDSERITITGQVVVFESDPREHSG